MSVMLDDICVVSVWICGYVVEMLLLCDDVLLVWLGQLVLMKCEYVQLIGVFKLCGVMNVILLFGDVCGVVIVLIGNYGWVLVYVVCVFGLFVIVCLLWLVFVNKVDVICVLGVQVCIIGDSQDQVMVEVVCVVIDDGLIQILFFDYVDVIVG